MYVIPELIQVVNHKARDPHVGEAAAWVKHHPIVDFIAQLFRPWDKKGDVVEAFSGNLRLLFLARFQPLIYSDDGLCHLSQLHLND